MPFYLLILLLIYAPIAYGSVGPISIMVVQAFILFGLLWVCVETMLGKRKFYRPPGLLPLCCLAGFMVLQLIPLPPDLLAIISPVTWQRYSETIWLLRPDLWMPLSMSVERSVSTLFFYLSYVGFYLFATQCLADNRRLKEAVRIVTAFAGIYALVSILEALLPNGYVLWVLKPWPEYAGKPFGSFINGNHFAGMMVMLLPLTFMLYLIDKPAVQYGRLKERFIDFCSDPQMGSHLLAGFAALLMATGIFLSLSRGGILSMLGSLLVLCFLLLWRKNYRRQAFILIGFVILLFFFVGIFGWSAIFESFANIRNLQGDLADGRLSFWRDCFALFRDFPLFGTGFGSFVDSYGGYQSIFMHEKTVVHAHNEYFELFTEAGLIGLSLSVWAAFLVLRDSWKAFGHRRSRFTTSLFWGCLSGLLGLLLHNLTEFNLHIGSNALYFTFFVALLVSLASTSSRKENSSELPQIGYRPIRLLLSLVVIVLAGSLTLNVGGLVAQKILAPYEKNRLSGLLQAKQNLMMQFADDAIFWSPLTTSHHYFKARVLSVTGAKDEAMRVYGRILQLRPLDSFYLQRAADMFNRTGDVKLAEALFKSSVELDRVDLSRIEQYAQWLLDQEKQDLAFAQIKKALALDPRKTRDFIGLMASRGVISVDMTDALPERALSWQYYANFLVEGQLFLQAESAYRKAIQLTSTEDIPTYGSYWAYCKYLEKNERYEESIAIIHQGLELFPDNANLHAQAGNLYERQGITYRALEEYRQALLLNPKLKWVQKRLDRL